MLRQHIRNAVWKFQIIQKLRSDIDRNIDVQAKVAPPPHLRDGLVKHEGRQRFDKTSFLSHRYKLIRHQNTEFRMIPAHQGFAPFHGPITVIVNRNLWQEQHQQLSFCYGLLEVRLREPSLCGLGISEFAAQLLKLHGFLHRPQHVQTPVCTQSLG